MTTITTAKLREIAHTLGTTPDALKNVIWSMFGVTIDDTPADTEEHDMAAMTITQEQFLSLSGCESSHELATKLERIGITIAPAEPPEAMVKLAREIAGDAWPVALATLQHAVDVARKNQQASGNIASVPFFTALGAA